MRVVALLMLVSGWLIGIVALVVLRAEGLRLCFCAAGLIVQVLALSMLLYGYRADVLQDSER